MEEADPVVRIRNLCLQISEERDPRRVDELLSALRDAVGNQREEARERAHYLARYYHGKIKDEPIHQEREPAPEGAQRIRALLAFLGLTPRVSTAKGSGD